ncbi:uncharacterized protein LOC143527384 [Brachyhypopomus gauderio]|uniref:uncharacterized protein LOC143527384 n=1 Tax=Brachyhypopomus gauderio TaxID=698409 RepID=UPI00404232CC
MWPDSELSRNETETTELNRMNSGLPGTSRERMEKKGEKAGQEGSAKEQLKVSRLHQMSHKEHMLSVEVGRQRAEFNRVLRSAGLPDKYCNEVDIKVMPYPPWRTKC